MPTLNLPLADLAATLAVSSAMGIACALLSVIVVLRRWAFIGEGIAHAGFGGAGMAWILYLLFPNILWLESPIGIYCIAAGFCLFIAWIIGLVTRRQQVRSDTAIGIVLVASLAWGFIAYGIYLNLRHGQPPPAWDDFFLGNPNGAGPMFAVAAGAICIGVVCAVWLFWKEILAYCFDPGLAEISGVRVGVVHYLLMLLLAATIILGMRLTGSLLITALLVLPGATALQLSKRLSVVVAIAVAGGLAGALAGPIIHAIWRFIPAGPAVVLVLVLEFSVAYGVGAAMRRRGIDGT